ncbi:MAG: NYN domain-containing protein [Candidatus Kerfeldbacteria bacterium]|nr:NYN domain-containing protein [Candidatus Kerfeldbacteria bacterium]
MNNNHRPIYAFIDASNIIYGTVTRDGEDWKLDFEKLYQYLQERYQVEKIFYFGGLDEKNIKQQKFYTKLDEMGYITVLKPVIYHKQSNGQVRRKANCDVDLTFYAMRTLGQYSGMILMSGDGDFCILLEYLLEKNRTVRVIANTQKTARNIKQLVGAHFTDINHLKRKLEYKIKRTHRGVNPL